MKRFLALVTAVYTTAISLLSLFTWLMKHLDRPPAPGAGEETNLKILLLVILAVAVMLFYEHITRNSEFFDHFAADFAMRFVIAYLASFFGGVWTNIIPFTVWMALLCIVFTCICVLVAYLLAYLTVSEYADTINRQLHAKKKSAKGR